MIVETYQIGFKVTILILLNITATSCTGSPSHAPPLKGDLIVDVNPEGIICFRPDSNSVFLGTKSRKDLEGIKDLSFSLSNGWYAKQKDEFEVVSMAHRTCIDEERFSFESNDSRPDLIHGETYTLFVSGLTADGGYRVNFVGMFSYP